MRGEFPEILTLNIMAGTQSECLHQFFLGWLSAEGLDRAEAHTLVEQQIMGHRGRASGETLDPAQGPLLLQPEC